MAIENKLDSRENVCRRSGKNFYSICDQLAAEEAYMVSKGLTIVAVDQAAMASMVVATTEQPQAVANKGKGNAQANAA